MARLSRLELPSAATITGAVNRRPSLVTHADDAIRPVVEQRLGHVGPLVQLGAGGDRVASQQVVEVGAGPDQPVRWESRPARASSARTAGCRRRSAAPCCATTPACSEVSMPSRINWRVARGVRPSPQTFSRGNCALSSSATCRPRGRDGWRWPIRQDRRRRPERQPRSRRRQQTRQRAWTARWWCLASPLLLARTPSCAASEGS